MVAVSPVDVRINPNNAAQRYVLWNNGRIDAIGGAPPVTDQKTWYTRFEPPGVAIHITNWTTGAGYVLDYRGGFNPFGGAPELGSTASDGYAAGVPAVSGIPVSTSPQSRWYVDWAWNPAGNGQGYVLDQWGQLWPFGGASAPPRTGRRFTWGAARKLAMNWGAQVRGVQMDLYGGLRPEFSLPAIGNQGAYWPGSDYARDFTVTNWTDAGFAGYKLNLYGGVHAFGVAEPAYGFRERVGADVARTIAMLSVDNPTRFWIMWAGGQSFDITSSTAPTVVAGGSDPVSPATTVTDTTRPALLWSYSDAQGDTQTAFQVLVFTQTFVNSRAMANPLTWRSSALVAREGSDPTARGIACPVDLPNGTYRMYVRARDTAGQWSAWSNRGWTQNVPVPATPTGLTATADQVTFRVALSVSATTGGSADSIRFECSDDAGVTWATVRGAAAVPIAATTTATDYDAPLGVARQYRAVAFNDDPAVASSPSTVASATLTTLTTVLTAVDDPTLGGRVFPQARPAWSRRIMVGEFQGIGADYPTLVKDGRPKARRATVRFTSLDAAGAERIAALVESTSTLVYRDALGEVIYCEVTGEWPVDPIGALTDRSQTTELQLVEVKPPGSA